MRARAGVGARHLRRPDTAPGIEGGPHLDRARVDVAAVEREVDPRADGVAEDDDPVGQRRACARGPRRGLVAAGVAESRNASAAAATATRTSATTTSRQAGARLPLPAGRGGTRSSRGTRRARRTARSRRAATGSRSSSVSSSSSASSRSSFARRRAAASFFVSRTCVTGRCAGSRSGTTIPLTSGKLCSQTGSWITTGTTSQRCSTAVSHVVARGRVEEVREDEDEAAGGDVAAVLEEVLERALDAVGRRAPAGVRRPLLAQVGEPALAARRQPERLAVGVVEVADEAARRGRARDDDVGRAPHRRGLVEPGQRRREEGELGAAVGDEHDARALVGVALADDELVGAARRRHPGRRGPVDRADVVARPVRAASRRPRCRGRAGRSASSRG